MKSAGLDALVMETSAMNSFILIGYGLSLGVGVFTWQPAAAPDVALAAQTEP